MDRYRRFVVWPLGILLVLVAGCGQQSSKTPDEANEPSDTSGTTLAYHWIPGQRFQFRYEVSQDLTITTPALTLKNYVRLTQEYSIETTEVKTDGPVSVQLMLEDVQVSMKEGENSGEFDSKLSRDPRTVIDELLRQAFSQLKGVTINITLDSSSEITRIQGLHSSRDIATQGIQSNFKKLIDSLYDESLIRQLLQFTQLPSGTIRPGQAWPLQGTQQFGLLGITALDGTARLMGEVVREGKPVHQIRFSGAVKEAGQSEDNSKGLFKLLSSQLEGRASFDAKLGQFVDGITTYELNVEPRKESVKEKYHVLHKHKSKLLSVHGPSAE